MCPPKRQFKENIVIPVEYVVPPMSYPHLFHIPCGKDRQHPETLGLFGG